MLYDLESFARLCDRRYTIADVTLIVAVRAHDQNPWVLQRLALLGRYYDPMPKMVIVDFGSPDPLAAEMKRLSQAAGLNYVFEPDYGTFSAACARNIGARHATTELLFFSDIDCFGERDMFQRLLEQAHAIDFGACFDQIIDLPVFHMSEGASRGFFEAPDPETASRDLARKMTHSLYAARRTLVDFVDPFSNFFLCQRRWFDLVGGFNENFRGHGSEDFEFLLRYALTSGQFPIPASAREDHYGVARDVFYGQKQYKGFRRLGELMAFQSLGAGLRIAHLWHPRPRETDSWYRNNDWKRSRFTTEVTPFLNEASELLRYDWMPRQKTALVLLGHRWQYEFFLPLRMAGYRLQFLVNDDVNGYRAAIEALDRKTIDAVAMFNPYMKSHAKLRPFFELARRQGMKTIVVERGALPESWYYADDVSYNDPSWCWDSVERAELSPGELEMAAEYITGLKSGTSTLEAMGAMTETLARYAVYARLHQQVCFVPLQLDDDMAVTQYTDGYQSYADFVASLAEQIANHPDVLFLIKQHPLSKVPLALSGHNVVQCTANDNVHGLIETAGAVICYNSGVGMLALIHGKRLVTIGNAFYNLPGLGQRAQNMQQAIELAFRGKEPLSGEELTKFVAWVLFRKYSFFKAESLIKEFAIRKSHNYKNLRFYHFNYEATRVSQLRASITAPCDPWSFASGMLGVQVRPSTAPKPAVVPAANNRADGKPKPAPVPAPVEPVPGTFQRKVRKLVRDPKRFLSDSSLGSLRWLGSTLTKQKA